MLCAPQFIISVSFLFVAVSCDSVLQVLGQDRVSEFIDKYFATVAKGGYVPSSELGSSIFVEMADANSDGLVSADELKSTMMQYLEQGDIRDINAVQVMRQFKAALKSAESEICPSQQSTKFMRKFTWRKVSEQCSAIAEAEEIAEEAVANTQVSHSPAPLRKRGLLSFIGNSIAFVFGVIVDIIVVPLVLLRWVINTLITIVEKIYYKIFGRMRTTYTRPYELYRLNQIKGQRKKLSQQSDRLIEEFNQRSAQMRHEMGFRF
ncbi:hypothetical protein MIR68_002952 [Amoeboaphelidium protococcarum]|nr:hypothetical protein MIR68_002952 [Amoeboaphelidium protococcarum]KAI3649729.1 hypothetical protein MP228_005361 [Amoeboaphelidium protococcarum]